MPGADPAPLRRQRTAPLTSPPAAVAVTGAASPVGRAVLSRLVAEDGIGPLVGVDTEVDAPVAEVGWHALDPADPRLAQALTGVRAVVHCAVDLSADPDRAGQRDRNLRRAGTVLTAAFAAGVRQVVIIGSAMAYGALPDNPAPIPDGAPLRAEPDAGALGDLLEIERLARRAARAHPTMAVTVLRPAILLGAGDEQPLAALFAAPRLLRIRGAAPRWQFCHVDDLAAAVATVLSERLAGAYNVASDGWCEHEEVERVSGRRSADLPERVAMAAAERLHRLGVTPAPPGELAYLIHDWTVDCAGLRAHGWTPGRTNSQALAAHVADRPVRGDAAVRNATAAAGAAVALAGTAALIRRARRNRR